MSVLRGNPRIRVLIADDSAFMRAALSKMVESDDSLCVVGTAQNGLEALAKISALQPDVVTLDIDMPGMNGIETLKRVMADSPRPVIIVSALTRQGAATTVEALGLGAFDCVAKQLSYASEDVLKVQAELVGKIKAAAAPKLAMAHAASLGDRAASSVSRHVSVGTRTAATISQTRTASVVPSIIPTIIAIGTSTGGPKALQDLLAALPSDLPAAVLIVQHMPIGFTEAFAKRLDEYCPLQVHEAQEGDVITAGHVYVTPAGKHLTVRRRSATEVLIHLSLLPSNVLHIPSADIMMSSVAKVFHAATMGIILTGMGSDGALGMQAIRHEGGLTVGQDRASCVVYGMPRCCAEMGVLSDVVALSQMPRHILHALHHPPPAHPRN
jgi:two-component system, chemotaxis family, protein-glutamate methylesterase/glutaminase